MSIEMKSDRSDRFYKILFQVFMWVIWIGYPAINTNYDNPSAVVFLKMLLAVRLVEIPFFYFIVHYLVPEVFRRKGAAYYVISLIVISSAYIVLEDQIKFLVNPEYRRTLTFFIFFPVIFVAALGTGYALVAEFAKAERLRQEEDQERIKSELSFLRSQISPHFIFNVLNSIVYLIRSNSDLAEPVTIQLSELLRYMLYGTDTKQVPVSKEIDYLKNYIDLQKVRYGDDVNIKLEINGNDSSLTIEPMLLIPFVENAFKHGVGMVSNPKIHIKLSYLNSELNFEVCNKIGPESNEAKDDSSGIGLKNVSRRLELLYPEKHELKVSDENGFFVTKLKINLKREIQ